MGLSEDTMFKLVFTFLSRRGLKHTVEVRLYLQRRWRGYREGGGVTEKGKGLQRKGRDCKEGGGVGVVRYRYSNTENAE